MLNFQSKFYHEKCLCPMYRPNFVFFYIFSNAIDAPSLYLLPLFTRTNLVSKCLAIVYLAPLKLYNHHQHLNEKQVKT